VYFFPQCEILNFWYYVSLAIKHEIKILIRFTWKINWKKITLRLFAKCCWKAKQFENRWPGLSWTTNPHIRVSHSFLYILRCPRARLLHASFRLSIFFLHIAYPSSIRPAIPASFVRPLFNRWSSRCSPLCPPHILRRPYVFGLISRQPPAIPRVSPLHLSCSVFAPLRFHHVSPPLLYNDAFIFPYPHRCYIVRHIVFVPAGSPRLFLLHSLHYPSGCIASARLYASNRRASLFSPFRCIHLFSPLLSQLVTSRCSPSSSLFPSVPVLVRLFDCISLAFPYLHCVSSRRGLIPADSSPLRRLRHAGLLRPFLLFELISRSPLIISLVACRHRCHFLLSFQNFPLFTLRPGCTSLSRRVRFHLKTDSIHLFIFRSFW